jgi:hypothetical protein
MLVSLMIGKPLPASLATPTGESAGGSTSDLYDLPRRSTSTYQVVFGKSPTETNHPESR